MAEGMTVSERGALAIVTLERPEAANALTRAMRAQLAAAVQRWARDPQIYAAMLQSAVPQVFATGGNIGKVAGLKPFDLAEARRALADEAALCWLLECFSKPTVALIDGLVMAGGVAIMAYATHRVAGAQYRLALRETQQGVIPRHGMARTLARLPDSLGMYLGLTGREIARADAVKLGLATHAIGAEHHESIRAALAEAEPVDPLLDALHEDPGPAELDAWRAVIADCFSAPNLDAIRRRLQVQTGAARDWAGGVLADLDARPPLALVATHRHIREAGARDLRQTLLLDYRLACGMLDRQHARDGRPAWQPSTLVDITPGMVERLFQSMGSAELILPTLQEMQAARV